MNTHELLDHIDPTMLDYQEWCNVGMALKHEGCDVSTWDSWSQRDSRRYHAGECQKKWAGFQGSANPVTAGTLVELAKRGGWRPEHQGSGPSRAFEWDDVIGSDELKVIDVGWVEDAEVSAVDAPPWRQLQMYLEALFETSDIVGYVNEAFQRDEKWMPKNSGHYRRTAGDLIAELSKYKDIGAALGDSTPEAGAWIRFNPLSGEGVHDKHVANFRHALIECDEVSIEKQAAMYEELELPIVALVHSGKKSLHAIVHIGAKSTDEYRERVNFLHTVCKTNGLKIDEKAKNPSRLSRMPGVMRNGECQSLLGLNKGKGSWEEWKEWIEELNDSLPDIELLDGIWDNLPALAPPLIDGVVRQGHKLLLTGASKAGKSFLLLELVIAIAEGRKWLGWQCAKGRVLYVNLELDRPSCLHRLKLLYGAFGWKPENLSNIDIWNLRGKSVPMDKLAPKLIRRAMKRNYVAVIIDPIYKVITGDENAADKMAFFCNQFDRICADLGSAVIFCHHHSKGAQGQKSSRDRSSGSGVFARDPDAILDLIELRIEKQHRDVLDNRYICPAIEAFLNKHIPDWRLSIGQDTAIVAKNFTEAAASMLTQESQAPLYAAIAAARTRIGNFSGWRLEGTLREFPPFPERRIIFTYPIHVDDTDGILETAKADGEEAPWMAAQREKKTVEATKKQSVRETIAAAHAILSGFDGEPVMIGDMAEHMGCTPAVLKKKISQVRDFILGDDNVVRTKAQFDRIALDAAIDKARDITGRIKVIDVAAHLGVGERAARNRLDKDERYLIINGDVTGKDET